MSNVILTGEPLDSHSLAGATSLELKMQEVKEAALTNEQFLALVSVKTKIVVQGIQDLQQERDALKKERDEAFERLRDIIGLANGDNGPGDDEWALEDAAEAVAELRRDCDQLRVETERQRLGIQAQIASSLKADEREYKLHVELAEAHKAMAEVPKRLLPVMHEAYTTGYGSGYYAGLRDAPAPLLPPDPPPDPWDHGYSEKRIREALELLPLAVAETEPKEYVESREIFVPLALRTQVKPT